MKFHCPKHPKKTEEHARVTLHYKGEVSLCKTKDGREIRCPLKSCKLPMEVVDEKGGGDYSTVSIGKFSSMSPKQKREHIKDRAKAFNKTKQNKDNKRYQATQHLTNHG